MRFIIKILILFRRILNPLLSFGNQNKTKKRKVKPPEDNYPLW